MQQAIEAAEKDTLKQVFLEVFSEAKFPLVPLLLSFPSCPLLFPLFSFFLLRAMEIPT
jgi:hypothetical protein